MRHQIDPNKVLMIFAAGALLHAHLDATVDTHILLELAYKQPAIHVQASERITPSTIATVLPVFSALVPDKFSDSHGLTESGYQAEQWCSIKKARESFDPQLGGPEGFDKWVQGALTINPVEAYKTHNTVTKVRSVFRIINHPFYDLSSIC